MSLDPSKLLSWSYLSGRFPTALSMQAHWTWLIICGLAILSSIVIMVWSRRQTNMAPAWLKLYGRVSNALMTTGIVLLILFWFRYERLPFLSMRLFPLLWLIILAAWLGHIVYSAVKKVPTEVESWNDKQRIAKYLPHK
jgi:hypothetical protein